MTKPNKSFILNKNDCELLKEFAINQDRTQSSIIRLALHEFFEKLKTGEKIKCKTARQEDLEKSSSQ